MKSKILISLFCLVILAAAFIAMKVLKATGPEAKQRPPQAMQILVDAMPLELSDFGVQIEGMGAVISARQVTVRAEVQGQVVSVDPQLLEGEFVEAGAVLAQIEPVDYELRLAQAQSTLALREAELDLEMGFQRVAVREWELLSESSDFAEESSSLALREPQLKKAKAMEHSASAALKQAQLDLERTKVVAPFNAVVLAKSIEIGSLASRGTEVATLVATDRFYVRVSIPVSKVGALQIPGAKAKVRVGGDSTLSGTVVSLLTDLDPDGRMARVLVEIKDPLGIDAETDRAKLLLGAYVQVELEGDQMPGTFTIPRNTLHNGDHVWIVRKDSTLEIRPVEVIWKNRETVVVRAGLIAGEQLITSSLSFAADGMSVKISKPAKALSTSVASPDSQK